MKRFPARAGLPWVCGVFLDSDWLYTAGMENLFAHGIVDGPDETVDVLLDQPGVRIERIVSAGHRSPDDFWYDQDTDEWVAVLQGQAVIQFESPADERSLQAGDFCFIPAHVRHRVEATSTDPPTLWLAVHVPPR
jgi:cupin 2 domain-containing protein